MKSLFRTGAAALLMLTLASPSIAAQCGLASWYGPGFHGRTAASGEIYNQNAMTAAHRTLPFGTIVNVTRTDDGRSVRVRITDRGPYIQGRVIDLSRAAAVALDMIDPGVVPVRISVVEGRAALTSCT
ncbi:MAG: septal ring lytic transglycosylase RlpA family protein [Bauldia sp.]|nr:septal ring lytic transglycosylase RlpA family protein [Bauldia sp.]